MSLIKELKCALTMLSPEDLDNLFLDLSTLGVEEPSDMLFVKEADLKLLKPIHARRLLKYFHEKTSSSTETPCMTSCLEPINDQVLKEKTSVITNKNASIFIDDNDKSSFIQNYKFPIENLKATLKQALLKKERPSPVDRRLLIRAVVDDLMKKIPRPIKKDLSEVAKKVVSSFASSLEDTIDGRVIGTGYSSFLNQLIARVENVSRNSPYCIRRKRNASNIENAPASIPKQRQLIDSYGCVCYNMQLEEEKREDLESIKKTLQRLYLESETDKVLLEQNFQRSYPLQREEIIEGAIPLLELKQHWPYLFKENGFFSHAKSLLGIDLKETLCRILEEKANKMLKFFKSIQNKNTEVKKHVDLSAAFENSTVAVFHLLMAHFKEPAHESLFLVFEPSTSKRDVEKSLPLHPCIVAYGDSMYTAEEFEVAVDGKLLFQQLSSFTSSVAVMLGTYFVFSIQYPVVAICTLEFIQRFFVRINPLDATSKAEKVKGKKCSNRKVFSLITEMAYYDWSGEEPAPTE